MKPPSRRPPGRPPDRAPGKSGPSSPWPAESSPWKRRSDGPPREVEPREAEPREAEPQPSVWRTSRPPARSAGRPRPAEPARRPAPPRAPELPPKPRLPPVVAIAGVDVAEVTVEKLVAGGEGLARLEGVPVFVPLAAPGDRLRVRLTQRRPDFARAEIVEILTPGPGRREPPCPFFARCGGCDLQHLEDQAQVQAKARAVLETLVHLGHLEVPADLKVIAGDAWGYRLRTQLQVDPEGAVGYFARASHQLVPVDRCPILVPALEQMLPELPLRLAEAAAEGVMPRRVDLAVGDGEVSAAPRVPGLPHGEIDVTVDGFRYSFDSRCFFQGHRGLLAQLVAVAVGPASWAGEAAYDLYGGVGLFALPLARNYRQVTLVEADKVATRYARVNARRAHRDHGVPEVEVVGQAVETWMPSLPAGVARVLVDPPRAGLRHGLLEILLDRAPERITYVSCHPAALARDLKILRHRYRVESLALVDLFPQTGHMEVVAQLLRL